MADPTSQTPSGTDQEQAQGPGQAPAAPPQQQNPLFTLLEDILGGDMGKFMADIQSIGQSLNQQVALGPKTSTPDAPVVGGGPAGQQQGQGLS